MAKIWEYMNYSPSEMSAPSLFIPPKILDQMIHASHSSINMNIISLLVVPSKKKKKLLAKKSLLAVAVLSSFCLANMLRYK